MTSPNEIEIAEHLATQSQEETMKMAARLIPRMAEEILAADPETSVAEARAAAKELVLVYLGVFKAAGLIRAGKI